MAMAIYDQAAQQYGHARKPRAEEPAASAPAATPAANPLAAFAQPTIGEAVGAGTPAQKAIGASQAPKQQSNRMDDAVAGQGAGRQGLAAYTQTPAVTPAPAAALTPAVQQAQQADLGLKGTAQGEAVTPMPQATPPGAPAAAPVASPSGFVGFDQYLNANAGAAKGAADRVNAKVSQETKAAHDALASQYDQWRQQQSYYAANGQADQLHDFAPTEGLNAQYQQAGADRRNLGSNEGVQALLGPGANAWDAGAAQASGATGTKQQASAFDDFLTNTNKAGSGWAAGQSAKIANQQAAAEDARAKQDREAQQATAKTAAAVTPPAVTQTVAQAPSTPWWSSELASGLVDTRKRK